MFRITLATVVGCLALAQGFKLPVDNENAECSGPRSGGMLNGYGECTYKNGDVYIGEFKEGKKHGKGVFVFKNGDRYSGAFQEDKASGQGEFIAKNKNTYVGEFEDGAFHGKGSYKWEDGGKWNGDRYDGEWVKGERTGQGKYVFANGNIYSGQFVNGRFSGEGEFEWHDGTQFNGNRYVGEFKDGLRSGKGIYYFANGDVYVGQFLKNQFHGQGVLTFKAGPFAGAEYRGQWRNDLMNGEGTFVYANGNKYEGEFANGIMNGFGTFEWKDGGKWDGAKYVGNWKNGKRNGKGKYTSVDGKVEDGFYFDNVFMGEHYNPAWERSEGRSLGQQFSSVYRDLALEWASNAVFGSGMSDMKFNGDLVNIMANLANEMMVDTVERVEARALERNIPLKFIHDLKDAVTNILFRGAETVEEDWEVIKADMQEGDWFANVMNEVEGRALERGIDGRVFDLVNRWVKFFVYDDAEEGRALTKEFAFMASDVLVTLEDNLRAMGVPDNVIDFGNQYVSSKLFGTEVSEEAERSIKMSFIETLSAALTTAEDQARSLGVPNTAISVVNDWISNLFFGTPLPEGRSMDLDALGLFSQLMASNLVADTVHEVEGRAMENGLPSVFVDFVERWYRFVAFGEEVSRSFHEDFLETLLAFFQGEEFQERLDQAEDRAITQGIPELLVRLVRDGIDSVMLNKDLSESRAFQQVSGVLSLFQHPELFSNMFNNFMGMNDGRGFDVSQMENLVNMATQLYSAMS